MLDIANISLQGSHITSPLLLTSDHCKLKISDGDWEKIYDNLSSEHFQMKKQVTQWSGCVQMVF